jgi:hypothetical protein
MKAVLRNLLKSKSSSGLIFVLAILFVTNAACLCGGSGGIDKEIVGEWQYQEMLGDARTGSMVIVRQMALKEDGTGVFVDGDGSRIRGKWYTNFTGFHFESESGNEILSGSYETNGKSILIYANGGKQLWERL